MWTKEEIEQNKTTLENSGFVLEKQNTPKEYLYYLLVKNDIMVNLSERFCSITTNKVEMYFQDADTIHDKDWFNMVLEQLCLPDDEKKVVRF